ncbi:dephospho-CoA kinase [Chelatococcus sp. GCM10030263]|uniref:dephospho-CoA kinase n=1 Tax=Chelatococcus sp. GCM10030263 TaxID=3273387 RepID=UPI00361488C1
MTFVLGLTGSIGMGKSTTAGMFRAQGIPVHDADEAVHRLYRGAAVPLIEKAFPGTTAGGAVDRAKLGAVVLGDPERLARLEAIVHPLVRADREAFVAEAHRTGEPLVLLDIPLLYETGAERDCDAVVVVSAPPEVQHARVLARPGMTPERFEMIHVKQLPDAEKRRRADFVVDTGSGLEHAQAQVAAIIAKVRQEASRLKGC